MRYVMDLRKALSRVTEDAEGVLTAHGMEVAHRYASAWVEGRRDLDIERQYPELAGLFWDIRMDVELARAHAA